MHVGDHQQFTAKVTDPTGAVLDAHGDLVRRAPAWATSTPPACFVATDPGNATVTARAGMQTATATVNVQGNAVGPSTFVHENPFPTGNDLWGGALAPGGLGTVFVGANGTVLAEDGSGQWSRLFSTPGVVLKARRRHHRRQRGRGGRGGQHRRADSAPGHPGGAQRS